MRTTPADNMATTEHLRNRLHPDKHEPNPEYDERTVVACWRCNNLRAAMDVRVFLPTPIIVLLQGGVLVPINEN
jgi:hypothetical protein